MAGTEVGITIMSIPPFQVTAEKNMQRNKREICIVSFVIWIKGTGHDFDLVQSSCWVLQHTPNAGY